jgi:hypothetical protein
MEEVKYCAFIDVLGYGNLVLDKQITTAQKIKTLTSIYTNLATQFWSIINDINRYYPEKVYIRSFSDCFYLDCSAIEPLLVAINDIFANAFGFYSNFSETEQRTPLLRCGIVKDWVVKFRDIAAISTGGNELNPVGLGVARAYYTSEETKLSGMRIIISPEVINDLQVIHRTMPEFPCYITQINAYGVSMSYNFRYITENEELPAKPCDLYELLWPFSRVNDHAYEMINILHKLKATFDASNDRHFLQTAKSFYNSYLLSEWKIKDNRIYERDKNLINQLFQS